MTLLCVRLENSFGVPRITALADTRATIRREDGSYKVLSDTTAKLFAIPIRCHALDNCEPVIGNWSNPYFETTIGLGFSGSCFEALTIIAHLREKLSGLVAPDGGFPKPTGQGLTNFVAQLCGSYFGKHSGDGKPDLFLLVFGFEDDNPWIGRVEWTPEAKLSSKFDWANDGTLEVIGQGHVFKQYAADWRKRIEKHRQRLSEKPVSTTADGHFERDLELSRHYVAERKSTEQEMLDQIDSEFACSIGGVLQRLELAVRNETVVAGFTRDDRVYLDGGRCSATSEHLLTSIPIVEVMGRANR